MKKMTLNLALLAFLLVGAIAGAGPAADKQRCRDSCHDVYRTFSASNHANGVSCRQSYCNSFGKKYGKEHTACVIDCDAKQKAEEKWLQEKRSQCLYTCT